LKPINPQKVIVDDNIQLPPSSNSNSKLSHSLKIKYAISLPTSNFVQQNYTSLIDNNNNNSNLKDNEDDLKQNENKFNDNNKKIISGSFTCIQLMTQALPKNLNLTTDEDTNTNISSTGSTFANEANTENDEKEDDDDNEYNVSLLMNPIPINNNDDNTDKKKTK